MAVYKKNGTQISQVYDVNGTILNQAYDIDGNPLLATNPNFTVMSYNVQWFTGNNAYKSMHDEMIQTYEPDVIGFQEFQTASGTTIPSKATEIYAPYYSILMGDYGNKNALASTYAMTDFETIPHTIQTMDGQSYSIAQITFEGKDVLLLVAHVTTSSYESTKVAQVLEVFEAVQDVERFIIMADFNTVCKSVYDTEYTTIMKQFVDAGYNVANCSPQWGFENTWTDSKTAEGATWYPCDHIITSSNIFITDVIIDKTKLNYLDGANGIDHLPIVARLSIM